MADIFRSATDEEATMRRVQYIAETLAKIDEQLSDIKEVIVTLRAA